MSTLKEEGNAEKYGDDDGVQPGRDEGDGVQPGRDEDSDDEDDDDGVPSVREKDGDNKQADNMDGGSVGSGSDEGGDEDRHHANKTSLVEEEEEKGGGRKRLPGIVYLGHIPPRLRPKHMRNMLTPYGEIGRIFLQPEDRLVRKKRRKAGSRGTHFTEGWVEFRDKRVAKRVAATLHNTPMGNKKHHRFHSDLWSMKYLHRFHWTHLSERLVYEQMVLKQRLRTEVSQAKRETNFYLNNVDKSQSLDKHRRKREREGAQLEERSWEFTQHQTEEEIQMKKMKRQKDMDKARLIQDKSQSNVSLLAKIFNASQSQNTA